MEYENNSDLKNKVICPLCCETVDYEHILEYHKEYWSAKGLYNSNFPITLDDFNKRFGVIGFKIINAR